MAREYLGRQIRGLAALVH